MNDFTKIAGLKTVKDWKTLRVKLVSATVKKEDWEEAYRDFLEGRIYSRYIRPIEAIASIAEQDGKGFSIVAICCTMIEFLESLIKGYDFSRTNYVDMAGVLIRSNRIINPVGPNIPLSVKEVFQDFLTQNAPFNTSFNSDAVAGDFYFQVRCAILHQAATGEHWKIKNGKETDPVIEQKSADEIILKWVPFKALFIQFLKLNYRERLLTEQGIQRHFIFKWDKICGI